MIASFYEDLVGGADIRLPLHDAGERWGDALDDLVRRGLVQVVAGREGDTWPTTCGACERELHREGESWLAICREEWCEPIAVDPRHAQPVPSAVVADLARLLEVGPVSSRGPIHVLGERRVGRHALLFVWCASVSRLEDVHLDGLIDDLAPDIVLVLLPHQRLKTRLPTRRRGRTRLVAFGVDELLVDADTVDLSEVWLRFRLGTLELLWPRYDLVVDGEQVLWAGRWVDLSRNPLFHGLFHALLGMGNQYATRVELLPTLFPDEFTNRGRVRTDVVKLDRRLRQLVSRLNAHFGAHPDGRPLIGNLRARSDIEGGYRIEVAPDRRFISQEDTHV